MTVYSNLCTDEGMSVGWNATATGGTSMGSLVQTITRAGFAWDPGNTRIEPSAANGMYVAPEPQTALNTDGWHSFYLNDAYHATYPLYINFAYGSSSFSKDGSSNFGGGLTSGVGCLFFNLSNACSDGGALTGATVPIRNFVEKTDNYSLRYGYPYVPYWASGANSYNSGFNNFASPGGSTLYPFDATDYVTAHSGDGFAYWMPVDDLAAQQGSYQTWQSAAVSATTHMKPQIYVHRAFDYDTGQVLPYAMMNFKQVEYQCIEANGANGSSIDVWHTMSHIQTINLLTGKTMKWQGQGSTYQYVQEGGSFPELWRWPMPTGGQQQTQYPAVLGFSQSSSYTHQSSACSWDSISGLPVYGKRPVFQNWWPVDHGEHPVFWPFLCSVPYGAYYPDDEITFAPSPAMASRTYKVMRVPVQKDALYSETKEPKIGNYNKNLPAKLLTIPVA